MIARREWLLGAIATTFATAASAADHGEKALKEIRQRIGGRLGVHVLDSQSGKRIGLEENSRFAMASTFKLSLAAALLWQIDRKAFTLEHSLGIARQDMLPNSPAVDAKLVAGADSMTIRELCAAAVTFSDNAAANVLLAGIGGPSALTAFYRTIGDVITRLDRSEPALNTNLPGDQRDTTTPRAMVDTMLRIFTQNVLSIPSRALLLDWMVASRTGMDRVRAGLPKSWNPGDKTGTGENGAVNDLVVAYPPGRRPIFIAVYMSDSKLDGKALASAHAQIGAVVAREKWA